MKVVWCIALWCSLSLTLAGEDGGLLRLTELTPHRIKGSYSTSEGGLHLDIHTSDKHHSLAISTLGGTKVLASKQHTLNSPLGISLLDRHFILAKDQDSRKHREFLLPKHMHHFFEPALKQNGMMGLLRNVLDEDKANMTRTAAIAELLVSREASLLIDAAKALAATGVTGQESPAAFLLYVLALRTQKLKDDASPMENTLSGKVKMQDTSSRNGMSQDEEFCTNANATCQVGACPLGDECTGLCGTSCDCWDWVCGNCCLNKMCYDHDLCCGRDGYVSWSCLGILSRDKDDDFTCSAAYSC